MKDSLIPIVGISTHTPAWGVTKPLLSNGRQRYISTHTPAWGVTYYCVDISIVGSISTHTPAWGVTCN